MSDGPLQLGLVEASASSEVELKVAGETTEERAKALVEEMLAKGLAGR